MHSSALFNNPILVLNMLFDRLLGRPQVQLGKPSWKFLDKKSRGKLDSLTEMDTPERLRKGTTHVWVSFIGKFQGIPEKELRTFSFRLELGRYFWGLRFVRHYDIPLDFHPTNQCNDDSTTSCKKDWCEVRFTSAELITTEEFQLAEGAMLAGKTARGKTLAWKLADNLNELKELKYRTE